MNMLRRRKKVSMNVRDSGMIRSPGHLQFCRGFRCILADHPAHECEGKIEACHVRTGTDGGTSLKPSDCWVVPICAGGHRLQHQIGEAAFETRFSINMKSLAEKLWRASKHRLAFEKKSA
jgi:hypothetical protein